MEQDENRLASLFPHVATQLRTALSNLHLAAAQLAPAEAREKDPTLDQKAALVAQRYYRLLRLVNSLAEAAVRLSHGTPHLRRVGGCFGAGGVPAAVQCL